MANNDRYDDWYAEKLWTLLPAIYRAEDPVDDPAANGPLREIVDRLGAQTAIVRRSIDRLWEDQSIETCDDWVIDYIGELLATNLVPSLDARGKRADVGKTIYYRRRKGTVAVLEELAGDITGWSVRVVEMFRRLGRTRHGLDPAIGLRADPSTARGTLQREEGLIGQRTSTSAGGFADLRSVHGASLTNSAFDEYFHTADVRRGRGAVGRYNIPHLGVFVWRLKSLPVAGVTAVHDATCVNQWTFDPTGREIALFAAGDRTYGDQWVSPLEQEVPGPISRDLLQVAFTELYRIDDAAHSLAVYRYVGGPPGLDYDLVTASEISQDPRRPTGRFSIDPTRGKIIAAFGVADGIYRVDYRHGFASEIGAGGYDRRVPFVPRAQPALVALPLPVVRVPSSQLGIDEALAALTAAPVTGSVVIDNSLTYDAVVDVGPIAAVTIRVTNFCRPLVRSTKPRWVFEGKDAASTLTLDGLFTSGGIDIVLTGTFARVSLVCCTLDPGRADGAGWANAVDGKQLAPSHLRIEGNVRDLVIDRCILGPITATDTFGAETLTITDSIVQATGDELALGLTNGVIILSRCTILGASQVHRIDVSESILHGFANVDDVQHGCVRFTAWTAGSSLPRKYESVRIEPAADLFGSRDFGNAAYAQVSTPDPAILEGAVDGSEMGAFSREKAAIKERSILIKYQEYLPLGLEPAIVHAT